MPAFKATFTFTGTAKTQMHFDYALDNIDEILRQDPELWMLPEIVDINWKISKTQKIKEK